MEHFLTFSPDLPLVEKLEGLNDWTILRDALDLTTDMSMALPKALPLEDIEEVDCLFILFSNSEACTKWCKQDALHWSYFLPLDRWEEWCSRPERVRERVIFVDRVNPDLVENLRNDSGWWLDVDRRPKLILNHRVFCKGVLQNSEYQNILPSEISYEVPTPVIPLFCGPPPSTAEMEL